MGSSPDAALAVRNRIYYDWRAMFTKHIPKRAEVFKDHRVAQLWGIADYKMLVDKAVVEARMQELAKELELVVAEVQTTKLDGVIAFLIGPESYIVARSWPEENYLHLNIFASQPKTNLKVLKAILRKLIPCQRISVGKVQYD